MATTQIRDDVLDRLAEGIRNLGSSEDWQSYLKMQARFTPYSFYNTLLIALQFPEATQVAGYLRWQDLGRQVRKGAKGIGILAPCRYRKTVEQEHADPVVIEIVRGFRVVYVFDVSITDGDPLPEIPLHRLHGDDHGLYDAVRTYVEGLGFAVELADFAGNKNGETNYTTSTVRIRRDLSPAQAAKTMAHEAAHCLLHRDFEDRALAELQAESVAFVVLDGFGICAADYSFGYVLSWNGEDAADRNKTSGQCIQQTARTILTSLGIDTGGSE